MNSTFASHRIFPKLANKTTITKKPTNFGGRSISSVVKRYTSMHTPKINGGIENQKPTVFTSDFIIIDHWFD